MDSDSGWVIPLAAGAERDEQRIGGKAAKLGHLARAGFRVPAGFCILVSAYERFVAQGGLTNVIRLELGRKPFEAMRWEEMWDAALRIRSAFLATPIPAAVAQAIGSALETLGHQTPVAVRSSAPEEDSANRSFAGLHESVVGVIGKAAVLDAVRLVWASLWSDAALLYRRELGLDPAHSCMAIVVQAMVNEDYSGVAFGRDPRDLMQDWAIVEAVPGQCANLVDGLLDPDRWIVKRSSGEVVEWLPGERLTGEDHSLTTPATPLLERGDLSTLLQTLSRVESLFGWPPDLEWTGRQERLTLLQARPITAGPAQPHHMGDTRDAGDIRTWYLSLRPGRQRLRDLCQRVAEELIPQLEALGQQFASAALEQYDDETLASAIEERFAALQQWKHIYADEFIPLAHGVRQLGLYYNDVVQPQDPYEFIGLLKGQRMAASQRNQALEQLALHLTAHQTLYEELRHVASSSRDREDGSKQAVRRRVQFLPGEKHFVSEFESLLTSFMDVAYENERLAERPDLLLNTVLEMAQALGHVRHPQAGQPGSSVSGLEQRLLNAVGKERHDEAWEILTIGRLSWQLRDDDNILLGRLESQLLRALRLAADRLHAAGRLARTVSLEEKLSPLLSAALRDLLGGPVVIAPEQETEQPAPAVRAGESPRQLVGQPAAPGLATGKVRSIRQPEDLGRFRAGEVLVCDAIQPTMTHLVPLACAVVERRGGMLIHGAIIARELGIPCVNGIASVVDLLHDDEVVTVDGYLGIVSVGAPDFDLEGRG